VKIKIPPGTQTGHLFRMKGKGMPSLRGSSLGDLVIEVIVETPVKLNARQKELLQELDTAKSETHPISSSFFSKIKDLFGISE
jgi:molecular chaperone DnaJ